MPKIIQKDVMKQAVESFATQPGISNKEVSELVGVHEQTIQMWRNNPEFIDAIYDTYMIHFGSELPAVLQSMINQAKAGNVQAGRLVLEHSGKLVKNINITLDSPFEKFLQADKKVVEYRDAEIQDIVGEMQDIQDIVLPPIDKEDQKERKVRETSEVMDNIKRSKRCLGRNKMYAMRKRAKAVGLEFLKGKPKTYDKEQWIKEIERRENES